MQASNISPIDVTQYMQTLGEQARVASAAIARASTADKNRALLAIAEKLEQQVQQIIDANALDMTIARKSIYPALCLIVWS